MQILILLLLINILFLAVRVVLRGKAHAEWKVVVSGDRRTVKDDQYFIDDRAVIWGKGYSTFIFLIINLIFNTLFTIKTPYLFRTLMHSYIIFLQYLLKMFSL